MSIWRWAEHFSRTPAAHRVTLGEGNTPLVRSRRIGPEGGLDHLYFKLEGANPTGSYKDRFGAAAVSDMLANGRSSALGTSSGNTGSAVAAYCAAAGIPCEIAIVETAPADKLRQMMAYGATICRVRGMGLDPEVTRRVMDIQQRMSEGPDAQVLISAYRYSPAGMAGVQTISYELAEQARSIDHVFVQAGGGGLALAIARGFEDLVDRDRLERSPAIHCVQPVGNDTMAGPLREGADGARDCGRCTSRISGLQVPQVIDGHETVPACRASGGSGFLVTDEATLRLHGRLAVEEGLFVEPAAAVGLAGALQARARGEIGGNQVVVCILTGIGFKDVASVDLMLEGVECPLVDVEAMGR